MTGELAALAAAAGWAISSVLIKTATPRVRALKISAVHVWATMIGGVIVAAAVGELDDAFAIPGRASALLVGGALIATAGDLVFLRGITIHRVGPIFTSATSLFVLLTVLGGWLLLGDDVPAAAAAGGAVIVAGIYLINSEPRRDGENRQGGMRGFATALLGAPIWAAGAAVAWSAHVLMIDAALRDADPVAANALAHLATGAVYLVLAVLMPAIRPTGIVGADRLRLGASGLLYTGGALAFLFALELSTASVTAMLSSSSPLFVVPLAWLFLKERFSRRSALGMALCIGGVFAVVSTT